MSEHSESVQVTTKYKTCDFCKIRLHTMRQCAGCGRDLCLICGNWWLTDPWTGDDSRDYKLLACDGCNSAMREFSPSVEKIRNKAEEEIEVIISEWKKLCLAKRQLEKE